MHRWFWITFAYWRPFNALIKHEIGTSIEIAFGSFEETWRTVPMRFMQLLNIECQQFHGNGKFSEFSSEPAQHWSTVEHRLEYLMWYNESKMII